MLRSLHDFHQPFFKFQKDITASILKDLVEYIVCKIPPLSEQYLAVLNNCGHGTSQKTFTQREISENLENKGEHHNNEHIGQANEHIGEDDKQCQDTPVRQAKKRKFDATYVDTQIKTLSPRETPKTKKKKRFSKAPKPNL